MVFEVFRDFYCICQALLEAGNRVVTSQKGLVKIACKFFPLAHCFSDFSIAKLYTGKYDNPTLTSYTVHLDISTATVMNFKVSAFLQRLRLSNNSSWTKP